MQDPKIAKPDRLIWEIRGKLKQLIEGCKGPVEQVSGTLTLGRRALGRVKGLALFNDFPQFFRTIFPKRVPEMVIADFLHDLLRSAA